MTMNISYSKALQMIRTMEKGLGYKVVEKNKAEQVEEKAFNGRGKVVCKEIH